MASRKVHFEIYLKRHAKDAWVLLEALADREAALSRAKAALKTCPKGSVRVSKETFCENSNTFAPVTIFEEGGEKYREESRADRKAELPCRSPADLVKPHAREAIARALRGWLTRKKATTLELLHRVDLVEQLEATGSEMQHAVQKIAIAQANANDASAQHFVKQLNELITKAVDMLYRETRDAAFEKIKKGELGDFAARIAGAPDRERRLRGVVAQRLKGAESWKGKFERLLDLAQEAYSLSETMAWPFAVIGEFIGEAAATDAARGALLAEPADLGAELDALTDLFCGQTEHEGRLSATGARLAWFFGEDLFDEARTAVARRILSELKSPKRLRPSDFDSEVALNRSLADRLIRTACPLLAASEISEAFVTRSTRLVEPESISCYLASAADPSDELQKLIKLEENVVGQQNKTKLAAYLRARCGAHQVETHFIFAAEPALQRLAELAEIRRQLDAAGFSARDKQEVAAKIDVLAVSIEDREQLFAKIEGRNAPPVDIAAAFLRLAAKGVLPRGTLSQAAQAKAMKLLARPEAKQAIATDPKARAVAQEIAQLVRTLGPATPSAAKVA